MSTDIVSRSKPPRNCHGPFGCVRFGPSDATNCSRCLSFLHQQLHTMALHDTKNEASAHIEIVDAHKKAARPVVGTIRLYDEDGIVLIPTPSRDPNGKL